MPSLPSYYDVLGLPRTASLDEIKKRYRELARQHHPDVNRDKPDAAKRFAEITTAYKTLSHPDDRAAYDADLALRERRAATGAARAAASTFPGTNARPAAGPGGPARGVPRSGSAMGRGGAAGRGATPAEIARLLGEAQAALARMKFVEAQELCRQVLRLDPRNARAYELRGDVYRHQNRTDEAINMYTMALQFDPRNYGVMQRLERLSRTAPPPPPRAEDRPPPAAGTTRPRSEHVYDAVPADKRPILSLLLGVFGYGLAFFLIFYLFVDHGEPLAHLPGPISNWSGQLIFVMGVVGLILGFTLAATAAVRRIEDELILAGARNGPTFLPLGLILVLASVVSFYAAALLYTIVALVQESFTPSMARIFGTVLGVVLLLTALYDPGRGQVFLFGGNVVFLALLVGWFLGDLFRPEGW